jgi:nucleotide-binding universal stress UspA family protein
MLHKALLPISFRESLETIENLIPFFKNMGAGKVYLLHIGPLHEKALHRFTRKMTPFQTILENNKIKTEMVFKNGSVGSEIVRAAVELKASFIATPFHKKNFMLRTITGSHVKDIVRLSDVPVLLYKTKYIQKAELNEVADFFSVFIPLSLGAGDKLILPYARHNSFKADRFILFHVGKRAPDPYAERAKKEKVKTYLLDIKKKLKLDEDQTIIETVLGTPRREILRHSKALNAHLIIMAKSDSKRNNSVFGSTAEDVSYNSACSTLIIPGSEN